MLGSKAAWMLNFIISIYFFFPSVCFTWMPFTPICSSPLTFSSAVVQSAVNPIQWIFHFRPYSFSSFCRPGFFRLFKYIFCFFPHYVYIFFLSSPSQLSSSRIESNALPVVCGEWISVHLEWFLLCTMLEIIEKIIPQITFFVVLNSLAEPWLSKAAWIVEHSYNSCVISLSTDHLFNFWISFCSLFFFLVMVSFSCFFACLLSFY